MTTIQSASRLLRKIFLLLFIGIPLFTAFYWIYFKSLSHAGLSPDLPVIRRDVVTNASTRYMAFIVSMIPASIMMYGVHHILLLLKNFEQGRLFHPANAPRITKIGVTVLTLVVFGLIYDALISFVITFHNPPGHHYIAFSLGMSDFTALILGGLTLLFGQVMRVACERLDDAAPYVAPTSPPLSSLQDSLTSVSSPSSMG